jgi:hypothetical protein
MVSLTEPQGQRSLPLRQPAFQDVPRVGEVEGSYSRCLLLPVLDSIARLPLLLLLLAAILMLQVWKECSGGR